MTANIEYHASPGTEKGVLYLFLGIITVILVAYFLMKKTVNDVSKPVTDAISGISSGISSTISGISSGISKTVSGISSGISSTASGVASTVSSGISSTASGVTSRVSSTSLKIANTTSIAGMATSLTTSLFGEQSSGYIGVFPFKKIDDYTWTAYVYGRTQYYNSYASMKSALESSNPQDNWDYL